MPPHIHFTTAERIMDTKHIQLPLTEESIAGLRAGDSVLLSGTVYTGRDAAHKRIAKAIGWQGDVRELFAEVGEGGEE